MKKQKFQPTPYVRRATENGDPKYPPPVFQPTPYVRRATHAQRDDPTVSRFQPTPYVRRATKYGVSLTAANIISTHALRA